jgi:hypothetical protein
LTPGVFNIQNGDNIIVQIVADRGDVQFKVKFKPPLMTGTIHIPKILALSDVRKGI